MKTAQKRESPVTGKKRAYVDSFVLDLTGCIQCELCVQVCNSDAITMVREPEKPGFEREDLVLDLDKLRANAKNKTASWGRGTVLQDMQEPPKPKVAKAEKPPKAEAPAGEAPAKAETPAKADAPKAEAAKTDAPKTDAPKAETPAKADAPAKAETPAKAEAVVESPPAPPAPEAVVIAKEVP
jgi:ferredoxin